MEEPIIYVDRRHTNCEKWDGLQERFGRADLLPLWVADMDFRVPQSVIDAEKEYLECGAFGYYSPPDSYYQAILDWEREEHGYALQRECCCPWCFMCLEKMRVGSFCRCTFRCLSAD